MSELGTQQQDPATEKPIVEEVEGAVPIDPVEIPPEIPKDEEEETFDEALLTALNVDESEIATGSTVNDTTLVSASTTAAPIAVPDVVPQDATPQIPEYAKDLDVNNQFVIDALNHFEGHSTEEWLKHIPSEMDADKSEVFKAVQSARAKWKTEQQKATAAQTTGVPDEIMNNVRARLDALKQVNPNAYEALDRIANGELVNAPVTPAAGDSTKIGVQGSEGIRQELLDKLVSARETGDADVEREAQREITAEITANVAKQMKADVVDIVKQQVSVQVKTTAEDARTERIMQEAEVLLKEDPRVGRYLRDDDYFGDGSYSSPMSRLLNIGRDVITGTDTSTPRKAHKFLLSLEHGTGKIIAPPVNVDAAQPPPGSGIGETPTVTQADMEMPFEEYLEKAAREVS